MATGVPSASSKGESRIPTQQDVSVAGGVWAPTSAKRDKLAELKVELKEHQDSLDDAATPEQRLDLYLADGVQWIVHTVDQTRLGKVVDTPSVAPRDTTSSTKKDDADTIVLELPPPLDPAQWGAEDALRDVETWLQQQQAAITTSTLPNGQLTQTQWETYLDEAIQKLDESLATLPPGRYLRHVRDLYEVPPQEAHEGLVKQHLQETILGSPEQQALTAAGHKLLARYRLLLAKATCQQLKDSWETLTTLTDEVPKSRPITSSRVPCVCSAPTFRSGARTPTTPQKASGSSRSGRSLSTPQLRSARLCGSRLASAAGS